MRFMPTASVACASIDIDPYDMAPVRNLLQALGFRVGFGFGV